MVHNECSSVVHFNPYRSKDGYMPAFVGRDNDLLSLCVFIRALPDRCFGDYKKCERKVRLCPGATFNHRIIIKMRPDTPYSEENLEEAFIFFYDSGFAHWNLHFVHPRPTELAFPDVLVSPGIKPGYSWCIGFKRRSGPVPDSPRIDPRLIGHPFYRIRFVMGHVPVSGEDAVFRRFFSPSLDELKERGDVSHAWRSRFGEFLVEQTQGSVRLLWSDAQRTKMINLPNENGDTTALYGFTVVLPWARDVLPQATAMCTDSTFDLLKDYTLAILHCIVGNESIPISFAVSPTEAQGSYDRQYDQLESILSSGNPILPETVQEVVARDDDFIDSGEELDRQVLQKLEDNRIDAANGIPAQVIPIVVDGLNAGGSDDEEEMHVDDGPPVFAERQLPATVAFLRSLPIVTDMGTALSAFVAKRNLNWKLCHWHILRAVGPKSQVGDWVNRLLRCNSEEEYIAMKAVIEQEIPLAYTEERFYPDNIHWIHAMIGVPIAPKKCLLVNKARWARWLRPGCPLTSNCAEAVHGRLNQAALGVRDWFRRLGILLESLKARYENRNTWCCSSLRRNWSKCYPTEDQKKGYQYWRARAKFYQQLHTARGMKEPNLHRKFREIDPRLVVPPQFASHRTSLPTPPSFQLDQEVSRRHIVINPEGKFYTVSDRKLVDIAWGIRNRIGCTNWKGSSVQILRRIAELATELKIPKDGVIPPKDEAKWRDACRCEVNKMVGWRGA
jgi:hypothetical protein